MAHYLRNTEKKGIEIYFDVKPSDAILTQLKVNHWRWLPTKGCWYNRYSTDNEFLAKELCTDTGKAPVKNTVEKKATMSIQKKFAAAAPKAVSCVKSNQYKTSSLRKDSDEIERDLVLEKSFGIKDINLYCYVEKDGDIRIIGELFATTPLKQSLCFICTLYDEDGDIIESKQNNSYGRGVVTSFIEPDSFFDGFPFSFDFYNPKVKVDRIKIVPSTSY